MWACASGHLEKVAFLLPKGADIHAEDKNGADALEPVKEHGNIKVRDILLKHGAGNDKR